MHEERHQLLKLLLDSARQYEVEGDKAAAKRLRQCAVGVAGATDETLVALGLLRLSFAEHVEQRIAQRPN